jgi:putative membrane protein
LAGLTGAAFDKAYVDNEVAFHKTVNSALSTTLIPDAQNSELKSLLQSGLKVFQAHLEHAERWLSNWLQRSRSLRKAL